MGNPEKNRLVLHEIISRLEGMLSGGSGEMFEHDVSKMYYILSSGYAPVEASGSDFVNNFVHDFQEYCRLLAQRRRIRIEGATREIATETEALQTLKYAAKIMNRYLLPFLKGHFDISDKLVADISNLGLAHVNAVTQGVADQYIPAEEAIELKLESVQVGRRVLRVREGYSAPERQGLEGSLKLLEHMLEHDPTEKHMRPFENVAVTPKNISRKRKFTQAVLDAVMAREEDGKFVYFPHVIFPIATGGTELGLQLANAYEDAGVEEVPLVYPLMFSMKTRKHRYPWIENDQLFLERDFEGQNFLVTEDWVTTGNTLRGIIQQLENTYPREIRAATIKRDPEKSQVPFLDKYTIYVGQWSRYMGDKTDALKDQKS